MLANKSLSKTTMPPCEAEERFRELLSYHPTHRKAYEELGTEGLEAIGDETAKEMLELCQLLGL